MASGKLDRKGAVLRTSISFLRGLACCLLTAGMCLSLHQAQAGTPPPAAFYRPSDPLNAAAFDHFYNLDYDRAIDEFDQILRRHPDDPFAVNHVCMAVLIRELYRMGAMNTGEYANDSFIGQAHRPADPKAKERIRSLIERATSLEEQRLKSNPNDVDTLYARGSTRAQASVYTGLVERAWFSALRSAVGARHDHERVLELNPNYVDAKLVVGTHNFVTGSLPLGVKMAVALVGLSGSKEKGLQYLNEAANANSETRVDAEVLLSLFLRREHRYEEALHITQGLIPLYPRNLLFALEEGNLLRSLGRNQEAAAAYRKIWQSGKDGHYPGLHYEMAALSLGDLLRSEKDYGGAAAAYELVTQVAQPDPEVQQKANLGAGEMYDLLQKRDQAVRKYEAVVASDGNTSIGAKARELIKEPYRE